MFDELVSPLFTTQWGRRTGIAITAVMGLFIIITLIQGVLEWRTDIKLSSSQHATGMKEQETNNQLSEWILQIPDWHLYGDYGAVVSTETLPITSLQIKLVGVIKGTSDSDSQVIISEEKGIGKVYKIGDVLPSSGVKVYGITEDGVVLENGGRLEKLPLQRTPLQFQGMPKSMGE